MWLTFPCGQNSELRAALHVDFPSRLDFIICSNRRLFCSWNEPEEAEVLAEGAAGQRPWWRQAGTFTSQRQPDALIPCEFRNQASCGSQGLLLASPVDQWKTTR